ncbi:transcription termination factor Rho, partial [bacterium]
MTPAALLKEAKAAKLDPKKMLRHELIEALLQKANPDALYARGVLETIQDFGFLRRDNYVPAPSDVFVSQSQIKKFNLRPGDTVYGYIRAPKEGEKYAGLLRVESVNTFATESPEMTKRKNFDELTPLFPVERLKMETVPDKIPERIIDIIAPIGKGQR